MKLEFLYFVIQITAWAQQKHLREIIIIENNLLFYPQMQIQNKDILNAMIETSQSISYIFHFMMYQFSAG